MHCVVTAGPTYEPLDKVRRLTNFSTGRLGAELASFLLDQGHNVTLLLGEHATYRGELRATDIELFTTTDDLAQRLQAQKSHGAEVVFHAAAVSDFRFGKVWLRSDDGELTEVSAGKISTREGNLLAELVPTSKIIAALRNWFPDARLVGWKYEVDGDRLGVIERARQQILECRTNACVANGPAYGAGFGIVRAQGEAVHVENKEGLFAALHDLIRKRGTG